MKYFSFIIILVHYFIVGMALQCYQCNSETHRRCLSEERLIDKFLVECPPSKVNYSGLKPTPFCSKINQWLYFTKRKREAVIRGCNYYHKFKDKCEIHSDRDSAVSVCLCGTDGCNFGSRSRLTAKLLGLQFFLYLLYLI
ncbi:uncharacterized protein LOC123317461 [Coccinella septempunctata]|uniref:uncharacterized protein LOC123317461 n=1 Tax=Coccinella septempunctata TaxID=41139 RepID=UPI001D08B93E|nr:uncharacterized protein LOC123317461 [Coccinella septempunctata]